MCRRQSPGGLVFCQITIAILMAITWTGAIASPSVFWASDPIRPSETAMVIGSGFGDKPVVEITRLTDVAPGAPSDKPIIWPGGGQKVTAQQANDKSLKFAVPANLKAGVFAYQITGPAGTATGLLNQPVIWWAQGDLGTAASPGGWVRVFGKCLTGLSAPTERSGVKRPASTLLLRGPRSLTLPAEADCYAARAALPKDLPVGEYSVARHSGCGGSAAWSAPVKITVEKPPAWPQSILNVKDFGADGTGAKDDTAAVQGALSKAQANGGGVVYFPRGRYQVTDALTIPRFTVLRGEKEEWACVFWPDMQAPPKSLLAGTNSFGIEDLTLYCSNYKTFLAADTRGDDAGDIFLRRVRVRANIYRGHMDPAEVDRRYREGVKVGFGGGYWLAVLGGRNIEVTDCDLYSSSCVLSLTEPRGARIERNILGSGRWGGSGVFGGDGVIVENNRYVGCDLMSWGAVGGLGYGNLSHVYLGRNSFFMENGGDREPITSDASGGIFSGLIASANATSITLTQPAKDTGPRWIGAAVYVVDGKGAGQWRKVAGFDGPGKVLVDQPWDVIPDALSTVTITYLLRQWLIVDNDFTDTGMAVQLYGAALEHIVAGNRSTRTAGYHNFGMNYHGIQPSWFVQWLDNEILEGNIYRADHDNWRLSGDAHIGVYGLIGADWHQPIALGTVIRRNHLRNNSSIVLGSELSAGKPTAGGRTDPLVTDVIVESNTIENSNVGVHLFQTTRGVWMTGNQFQNVQQKIWDEAAVLRGDEERRKKLLSSATPMVVWDFDKAVADASGVVQRVPDTTGNGFEATSTGVRLAADGVKGQAGKFSGESYLRVDESAMFNLQTVTLSLWIKPETVKGRHGLISKRFVGTAAPFILSIWDGALEFEATDETGKWSFNFRTAAVVKEGEWNHIAAVVEEGKGVTVYCNGQIVGTKESPLKRLFNGEPLMIGRESWGGIPNSQDPPCFFQGMMDEVKVWARALTVEEIKGESRR